MRFRKAGFSTYLSGAPWSDDFMRQYAAALDGVAAEIGKDRTIPGSVDALVVSYYKLGFPRLKISTHAERRWIIERFRGEHGTKPVRLLKREHIAAIIAARSETPHAANNLLKTLHTLFEHAIAVNMITSNPAADVKKFRIQSDGFRPWTEAEVAQYVAYHPVGSRALLALALLLTGQRRSDVVRMGWQHIAGGAIAVKQEKTGSPLLIPLDIDPLLPELLASVPKTNMTFLVTKFGAPFTTVGFSNWFRLKCDEAGLPQCSARPAQAGRDAPLRHWLFGGGDQSHHRPQVVLGSGTLHKGPRSKTPRGKRLKQAQARPHGKRTTFVQPPD